MSITLSPRLLQVSAYLPENAKLCDVGSDHAYLPVYALQNHLAIQAIAGEVVQGPFESAVQTVQAYGLSHKIDVRFGDGLTVLRPEDEITAITICGMGGELIASILERGVREGFVKGHERLILQPNVAEHLVRSWLSKHHYQLIHEVVVEDHQRLYEIMVAIKTEKPVELTPLEIQYGPLLMKHPTKLVVQKWQRQLAKVDQILKQLENSQQPQLEKVNFFTTEYQTLKGLIEDANR